MADNVLRKPTTTTTQLSKPADGSGQMPARKISAPVHRTTTETIRLGEPIIDSPGKIHHHHGQSLSSMPIPSGNSTPITPNNAAQCRTKKTSSFQITSVTVGCRMSNDTGEDSNDDLDESHTEDNSIEHSRITDIETPSYSEDTFSKDDVFFNASNAALSTAPVIPTSSQYGLAIVPSSEANNANNSTNDSNINTLDITSVTDNNIINLLSSNAKQDADLREVHSHGRNERFKVVKIESTEPFKRGRWTCMDYLDHTSVNQPTAISTPKVSDPNEVCISYGVTDAGIVVPDSVNKQQQQVVDDKGISIDANGPLHQEVQPPQQQQQQQQHPSIGAGGYAVPAQQQQQVPPQYFQSSASQTGPQPQQQQQQQTTAQGATLPTNLQSTHPNNLGQTQSMPQGSISILTQQGCPVTQANSNVAAPQQSQQNIAHPSEETTYVPVNSQGQTIPPQGQSVVTSVASQTSQAPSILVPQQQQQQQPPTSQPQPQQTQISEPIAAMQGMQGMQNIHKVPQPSAAPPQQQQQPPQLQPQSQVMAPSGQMQPGPPQQQAATGATTGASVQMVGGMQQGNIAFHQQQQPPPQQQQPSDQEQDSMSGMVVAGTTAGQTVATDVALQESLAEVTQNTDDHQAHEDNESMSGTSAVAIDNKIEQAMDLVKSHLMFAVREEVEVLKERIAELMDRINQLEAENSILKAHATPETLAQLSHPNNNAGSGQ
ncbi:protein bunched, class 2/F/G isoform [Nasonia vitripennis]|uniref:Uncharacterized protein n=1 Tax=Nasonia vitripennis TaxID=7425 RepID=A0A7M7QHI7_NASVI|nr:protein bunched, class 2/F/G isoform [Nasonia vitripennis]XP_016845321.1 protein bunched, class 2/F/G isoform [Nasonia vitripennis]XP_031786635.1 protein bunched, class 2/F/G isoform [Nasonia vitripennis]XP_031786636.1 protein bunched, class 2/F/G isoform [Nasonia vitripennis]XP_031786637.1 protein bunched, class 2/F/G isoform [Nasonia vitripennis]